MNGINCREYLSGNCSGLIPDLRTESMNILYLLKPKAMVSYVSTNATVRQGLEVMRAHGYTAIPVIDENGGYAGSVSEGDFLWHILRFSGDDLKSQELYSVMDIVNDERNLPVKINVSMDDLLLRVMDQNFVPVIDDRNIFIGIITRRDIIKYFYDKL